MKKLTRVRDLTPDAKNANKGTERGSGMLEQSLRDYGAGRSVLVDRDGKIIAGNKTIEAAASLGMERLQVVDTNGDTLIVVRRTDLSLDDKKAKELAIADNRSNQVGLDWDPVVLATLDVDLSKFFLENELEDLLAKMEAEPDEPQMPTSSAENLLDIWGVKEGDIFAAGEHRIMCGDSTRHEDLARLMNGKKAGLINTDPPYGVSYQAGAIKNDELRDDRLAGFLTQVFVNLVRHSTPRAAFYIWHASSTRRDFEDAMLRAGLKERQYITWIKDSFVLGHADYHWQTEPCFYACKDGETVEFHGNRAQATAWRVALKGPDGEPKVSLGNGIRISNGRGNEIFIAKRLAKDKKLRLLRLPNFEDSALIACETQTSDAWQISHDSGESLHPTQKPTELAARAIRNSSIAGDIVLDPFLGAGFTLLGAQHTGRVCYGMELEPKFVAVCLERLKNAGLEPQLCGQRTEPSAALA